MAKAAILYRNLASGLTPTAASSVAVSGLGYDKLNDPQPRHRARIASTGASIIFDLGSAQAVDLAALLSTSLVSADKLLLRASSTDTTAGSNVVLYSQDFTNAIWTKGNIQIGTTNNADPLGGTAATRIEENTTSSTTFSVNQNLTLLDNAAYFFSIYLKASQRTWGKLAFIDKAGGLHRQNFNLSTGALGSETTSANNIINQSLGSGWFRYGFWANSSAGASTPYLQFAIQSGDGTDIYAGTVGSGILAFGAQVDYGTIPSNYILTTSALVEPAFTTGVQSGVTSADYNGNVIAAIAQQTQRYWRWDVLQAANPIDIGLMPFGVLFRPGRNFQYGAQEGLLDLSVREPNPDTGAEFGLAGPKKRTKLLTFSGLTKAEIRDTFGAIDRLVGASGDVLFVEDPESPWLDRARDSIWGSYRQAGPDLATRPGAQVWSRSMRFTERL